MINTDSHKFPKYATTPPHNIMFDILKAQAFQKYQIHWVVKLEGEIHLREWDGDLYISFPFHRTSIVKILREGDGNTL